MQRVLYRYRSFDEFTKSLFEDHSLYFSKPELFNDPFDCQIFDQGGYTANEVFDYLTSAGMPSHQASFIALKGAQEPGLIEELLEKAKQLSFGNRGLLCLSKRYDDILMWSHYAKNHTGFVLAFDVLKDPGFFNPPLEVDYVDEYPAFQYLKDQSGIIKKGALAKSKHWKYEQEVRVIKPTNGLIPFSKTCLVEVILGARITSANRDQMIGYLKDDGYAHVTIKQARISRTKYEVEFDDLRARP